MVFIYFSFEKSDNISANSSQFFISLGISYNSSELYNSLASAKAVRIFTSRHTYFCQTFVCYCEAQNGPVRINTFVLHGVGQEIFSLELHCINYTTNMTAHFLKALDCLQDCNMMLM
jgi:hypothetical protein